MKRAWFLLLALSLGLNVGLLYVTLSPRSLAGPAGDEIAAPALQVPAAPPPGEGHLCSPADPLSCDKLLRRRLHRMAGMLHLEAGQRDEMHGILGEMLPRIMAERERVQRMRARIHEEYMKPAIDPGLVRTFVADLNAAQARLDSLTAETILRESEVLSVEQRSGYFGSMAWEGCRGCPPPGPPGAGGRYLRK